MPLQPLFLLLIGRSWLVGLSGPLMFFFEVADHINHVCNCSCFCYCCCFIVLFLLGGSHIFLCSPGSLATNAWPRRAMTPETSSCQRIKGTFITLLGQRHRSALEHQINSKPITILQQQKQQQMGRERERQRQGIHINHYTYIYIYI